MVSAAVDHSAIIAELLELEQRFEVAGWAYEGVPLWPQLRTQLAFKWMGSSQVGAVRRAPGSLGLPLEELRGVAQARQLERRDPQGTVSKPDRADVVTLSYPSSRVRVGEHYWDRFFDPIADAVEAAGGRLLQLEFHREGTAYLGPRHRPSFLLRPLVARENLLGAARRRAPRAELPGYAALRAWLAARHGSAGLPEAEQVLRHARQLLRLSRAFEERLLSRVQPRLLIVSCYYNIPGWALCMAARRLGIVSVDLQHGVTLKNPAYHGWSRFPRAGYPQLPDLFWCWTEADTAPVRGWPAHARVQHQAFVGGQPWAAHFEGDPEGDELAATLRARRGPGLNVLVSMPDGGLPEAMSATLGAAPADWRFWVRMHPRMLAHREAARAACEAAAKGRYVLDEATDLPLPVLLRELDVHLTLNSTVLQEAMAYGMPTVLLDPNVCDVYARELASGWAVLAAPGSEAVQALVAQHAGRARLPEAATFPSRERFVEVTQALYRDPVAFRAGLAGRLAGGAQG